MEFFYKWLALAAVQGAATMSPGPAFAMSVRQTLAHDRRTGILTSVGLGIGVGIHVLFVVLGISVLISKSVMLFNVIKYGGAAYLVYIGIKGLMSKKAAPDSDKNAAQIQEKKKTISAFKAVQTGILTNVLNPKAVAFFTAFYAQFTTTDTPIEMLALYGATSVAIEMGWFSLVSIFLTTPEIRKKFIAWKHWVERVCGGLLVGLGIKLAISKV